MLAKLLCTKRKSASAPRCLRCLGATIDIVNSITRTANRSGQGGIFASMFTKGQHRGHGDHWAWRLTGNYCIGKHLERRGFPALHSVPRVPRRVKSVSPAQAVPRATVLSFVPVPFPFASVWYPCYVVQSAAKNIAQGVTPSYGQGVV